MNWNKFKSFSNNLRNLCNFSPSGKSLTIQSDIKDHKLMIRRVINTWLNSSFTILIVWPEPTKILSEDLDTNNFLIFFMNIQFNFV